MSPACPWCVLTVATPGCLLAVEQSPALWALAAVDNGLGSRGVGTVLFPPRTQLWRPGWGFEYINIFPKPDHVTCVCLFIFMSFMNVFIYLCIYALS